MRLALDLPVPVTQTAKAAVAEVNRLRVGVYVDGFDLYRGGRHQLGSAPGWRWLDIRSLADDLVAESGWSGAAVAKIVYCTARIDERVNPAGADEQDVYVRALQESGSVDRVEWGTYVTSVVARPLAVSDPVTHVPRLVRPAPPVSVRGSDGRVVSEDGVFLVSTLHQREKGCDVNVATHMLLDMLRRHVDAAVVIGTDSALKLPLKALRDRGPTGVANPYGSPIGGGGADARERVLSPSGRHWSRGLRPSDFTAHQLPGVVGRLIKPSAW
ncbi:MAG: NYN domain-containing protein [Dermatophilus congolensis]|nr:NYN domain-containing protein [Dermatophilus congolensis]